MLCTSVSLQPDLQRTCPSVGSPTVQVKDVADKMRKVKVNNLGRDQGRRMNAIKKKVNESWSKAQNPNLFGGGPVVDNSGKIISVEISAFGFVAEFF